MKVLGLDHIVLVVSDVERALAWYGSVLGMAPERVEEWRAGAAPFPSVRVDERTVIDLLAGERSGENMNHVCFVVAADDFEGFVRRHEDEVESGPVPRWGAQGDGTSVYLRDPDGNLVEVRHY